MTTETEKIIEEEGCEFCGIKENCRNYYLGKKEALSLENQKLQKIKEELKKEVNRVQNSSRFSYTAQLYLHKAIDKIFKENEQ